MVGQLELAGPASWSIEPRFATFELRSGEVLAHPFTILLPYGATNGEHPIRADFEIGGERGTDHVRTRRQELAELDIARAESGECR